MVPNGWKRQPLEQVAEVRSGVAKGKTGLKDPVTVPYLRVANVQDGYINLEDVKEIEIERDKLERFSLKKGDVLMNEGGDFDKLGRGDVWLGQIEPCLHQNHVFAVRPDQELIDSFFLAALAASHYGKTYFLSCAKRSTNLASINSTQIKEFPVLVPPLPEQKKIAQIFSTWDKAITTTELLLTNSHQQKTALMQQLFTCKKRLLDDNGVRFSGEWRERLLGYISKITTGRSNRQDSHMNGAYTFFDRSEDIRTSDTYLFDCEAVIVPGEGQDFIPKYFVGKFDLHQRTYAIMDFPECHGKFLFYAINYFRSYFLSQAVGSTVKSLRLPMFEKMKIRLPTLEEQQKIAAILSTADQEITALQQQLDHLKQEKKALMQQLLTGKRRVKIDDKEFV
ncbi:MULTISPECIES: restriction endonuclease subunit S [Morganellaceae]|uniref:restriction endonuclease subunit S n=1 Tax=Morganellaceae TaxID=1903414 RepID=UPI000F89AA79|nr:restriction endonuclease subunit S [Proteus mirabilis]RUL08267.1 restriction endonuclease subunit S [Proteus mirabilis]HEK2766022.1 restriction endonuclease subunit S [Proteus mirabilis]